MQNPKTAQLEPANYRVSKRYEISHELLDVCHTCMFINDCLSHLSCAPLWVSRSLHCSIVHSFHLLLLHAVVVWAETCEPRERNVAPCSAWLRNEDSPVVARLTRLIEAATNLTMTTAEDLQVGRRHLLGRYSRDACRVDRKLWRRRPLRASFRLCTSEFSKFSVSIHNRMPFRKRRKMRSQASVPVSQTPVVSA